MANIRGYLPLCLTVDGSPCESESTYTFAAGGTVLTIATVLPARGFALELVSTYTGSANVPRHATHLTLGPPGERPSIVHHEQVGAPAPNEDPRACAYDHAHELIERLTALGHEAQLALDEHTFTALERVE